MIVSSRLELSGAAKRALSSYSRTMATQRASVLALCFLGLVATAMATYSYEPKPGYEPKPEYKPDPKYGYEPKPEYKPDPKYEYEPEPEYKPDPKYEYEPEPEYEYEHEPEYEKRYPKCYYNDEFKSCKLYVSKGYYYHYAPQYYSPCCKYVRKASLDCLCEAARGRYYFKVDESKVLALVKKCGKYVPKGKYLTCKPAYYPPKRDYPKKEYPPPTHY